MEVNITKGVDTDLSFYYKSELELYKKFDIISSNNIFHAILFIDDGQNVLYNLVVYDEQNYSKVIDYLIQNDYFNINFDFNHINKEFISELLTNNYNMPYILEESNIFLPVFNLLYNTKIDKIDINYINYMIDEYNNQDKTVCEAWATFNKETLKFLYERIQTDKKEISGKLAVYETIDEINKIVFEINHTFINNGGNKEEVDSIESKYNFHTHPKVSYYTTNTELGWPSMDDYIIFILAFIIDENPTHFHWVCTVEGIYVLTIPKESVNDLLELKEENHKSLENDIEEYLLEHIDVNKNNFKKNIGIKKNNMFINSIDSYLHFIQKAKPFHFNNKKIKLFEVTFFDWNGNLGLLNNNRMYFKFYYPKIKGNCIINSEHYR